MKLIRTLVATTLVAASSTSVSGERFHDPFSGVDVNGMGPAWNVRQGADLVNIGEGSAVVRLTEPRQKLFTTLNQRLDSGELSANFTLSDGAPAAGYIDGALLFGISDDAQSHVTGRLRVGDNSKANVILERRVDGVTTKLGDPVELGTRVVSGSSFNMKLSVSENQTVLKVKVWSKTAIEPTDWSVIEIVDDTNNVLSGPGKVGVRIVAGSTFSGSSSMTIDNMTVNDISSDTGGISPNVQLYQCPQSNMGTDYIGPTYRDWPSYWISYGCVGQITSMNKCMAVKYWGTTYTPFELDCEPL